MERSDSRPWSAEILARLSGGSATELEDTLASGVNIRRLASERGVTSYRFDRMRTPCVEAGPARPEADRCLNGNHPPVCRLLRQRRR